MSKQQPKEKQMTYEIHDYARMLPDLSEVEKADLLTSLEKHGQKVPITLFEGKVLDGRHRAEALAELGVKPDTIEFEGTAEEALDLVVSLNLVRRHLTQVQRAKAGLAIMDEKRRLYEVTKAETIEEGRQSDGKFGAKAQVTPIAPDGRGRYADGKPRESWGDSRTEAAKTVGVGNEAITTMARAKENPEVWDKVERGEFTKTSEVKKALDSTPRLRALKNDGGKFVFRKVEGMDTTQSAIRELRRLNRQWDTLKRTAEQRVGRGKTRSTEDLASIIEAYEEAKAVAKELVVNIDSAIALERKLASE